MWLCGVDGCAVYLEPLANVEQTLLLCEWNLAACRRANVEQQVAAIGNDVDEQLNQFARRHVCGLVFDLVVPEARANAAAPLERLVVANKAERIFGRDVVGMRGTQSNANGVEAIVDDSVWIAVVIVGHQLCGTLAETGEAHVVPDEVGCVSLDELVVMAQGIVAVFVALRHCSEDGFPAVVTKTLEGEIKAAAVVHPHSDTDRANGIERVAHNVARRGPRWSLVWVRELARPQQHTIEMLGAHHAVLRPSGGEQIGPTLRLPARRCFVELSDELVVGLVAIGGEMVLMHRRAFARQRVHVPL